MPNSWKNYLRSWRISFSNQDSCRKIEIPWTMYRSNSNILFISNVVNKYVNVLTRPNSSRRKTLDQGTWTQNLINIWITLDWIPLEAEFLDKIQCMFNKSDSCSEILWKSDSLSISCHEKKINVNDILFHVYTVL